MPARGPPQFRLARASTHARPDFRPIVGSDSERVHTLVSVRTEISRFVPEPPAQPVYEQQHRRGNRQTIPGLERGTFQQETTPGATWLMVARYHLPPASL